MCSLMGNPGQPGVEFGQEGLLDKYWNQQQRVVTMKWDYCWVKRSSSLGSDADCWWASYHVRQGAHVFLPRVLGRTDYGAHSRSSQANCSSLLDNGTHQRVNRSYRHWVVVVVVVSLTLFPGVTTHWTGSTTTTAFTTPTRSMHTTVLPVGTVDRLQLKVRIVDINIAGPILEGMIN